MHSQDWLIALLNLVDLNPLKLELNRLPVVRVGGYFAELLGWGLSDRASLSGNGNGVREPDLQTYVCQSKTTVLCKRYCLGAIKQRDCTERSALMRSPS